MTWEKSYSTIGWKNKQESETTPLGRTLLSRIDMALNEIDNRVIELNNQKAAAGDLDNMITGVSYNKETGVITFTKYSGSVQSFDLSEYISNIEVLVNRASSSATTASQKASEASASATSASKSAVSAKEDADRAEVAAKNAEAVSGVGIASETIAGLMAGGDNAVSEDGTLMLTKTTTDRTLTESHAGGLKINSIEGESQQDGTPSPDAEAKIKNVEVSEIKGVGKNHINFADFTLVAEAGNNYKWLANVVTAKLKPNTTYTLSFHSDFTKTGISAMFANNASGGKVGVNMFKKLSGGRWINTITTPDDVTNYSYLLIYAGQQGATAGNTVKVWDIQIEEGSTATPYEPYHESIIQLSTPITLNGIGDTKDSIVKQDGVYGVLRNIAQKTISATNGVSDIYANTVRWYSQTFSDRKGGSYTNGLCDKFIISSSADREAEHAVFNHEEQYKHFMYFFINKNRLSASAETTAAYYTALNTWLKENPVMVQYVLATPTFEPLPTADQIALHQLETFDTVTYISTDSEIEPVIEVEYGTSKVGAYALKGMNTADANALKIEQLNTLTSELATQ